ncbi:MAG: DDE-type integrase/transposase/recombinase, partial [Candidatus Microthrix parvicella]
PWRYCTKADGTPPAGDLIRREFNATEPGVRFVGDITQIDTWAGPGYLATVIDLFNREVVGWAIADHHRADLICDAIRMAKRNKRIKRRAIFHSDRGSEYTSRQFRRCLKEARMRPSMGRVGTCPLTGQSRGTLSACASTSIGRFNRHYPGPPGLPIFDWPDNVTTMLWRSRSLRL